MPEKDSVAFQKDTFALPAPPSERQGALAPLCPLSGVPAPHNFLMLPASSKLEMSLLLDICNYY